jgi:propionate CoA-transferase
MVKILTAQQAAELVKSQDVLIVGGNGGTGVAERVLEALEARFLGTGAPQSLTLFHVTGVGAVTEKGMCRLAYEGLISRVIGGNYGLQLPFMKLILEERLEAYNFPQGVMAQLCRTMAARQPGVLTHVGLHTYMDPRQEGGRMNARTTEQLVSVVPVDGQEFLLYRAPMPTVAILRGTSADEDGYISMEHEATTREDLSIAQAVHNAGGTVIVQVKRIVKRGTQHPQMVKIPGFLVDAIVVDPTQMQTYTTQHDGARCGDVTVPVSRIEPDPISERRVIARRGAFELHSGDVVNLGVGVSAMIPNVTAEEGFSDEITLTVESGIVGGVPGHAREFGTAVNPRAILDQPYQFDFYDGGGLDIAFLSFAEIDPEGNVNVTRFGDRYDGSGGFIDISQNTKRLVFSGTLVGGGLVAAPRDGQLHIERDGKFRKMVKKVGQISFSGPRALANGQQVTYITERAVFRLTPDGVMLTEIAPGVDLQRDVLDQMDFVPAVSPELRLMDERIFRAGPMGLKPAAIEKEGV